MTLNPDQIERYLGHATELGMKFGPRLAFALLTLFVGFWLVGRVVRILNAIFDRQRLEPSLRGFLISLSRISLQILLIVTVAGMVGIEITSFIALFGAAGIAFGMALSGTLQNFAGGVIILVLKPFQVGDFVEMQGYSGTVKTIQIFHTILNTPDNKVVILPNAPISSGAVINFSRETTRRVDITFGIGYGDDIDLAKSIISKIIAADERVLNDPGPFIAVSELADSSVNIVTRSWVHADNYWPVKFLLLETVKKTFDQEGISIPFPQSDVHLHQVAG